MRITSAFIEVQGNNALSVESQLVSTELSRRRIPHQTFTRKQVDRRILPLSRTTLVVGDMGCTFGAMKQLGVPIPENNDYPVAIAGLRHRNVWRGELREIERYVDSGQAVFVKPRGRKKRFPGFVVESTSDLYRIGSVSRSQPVFFSDVVKWISEYRVYVVESKVVSICHYSGDESVGLDRDAVLSAVEALDESEEGMAGYAIDFGVIEGGETALVEMNDGFSIGAYGIEAKEYTDLLISRWAELTKDLPNK